MLAERNARRKINIALLAVIFSIHVHLVQAAQVSLQCESESVEKALNNETMKMNVPIAIDPVARRVVAFGARTDIDTTYFTEAFVRADLGGTMKSTFSINRITGDYEYIIFDLQTHTHTLVTYKGSCRSLKPVF